MRVRILKILLFTAAIALAVVLYTNWPADSKAPASRTAKEAEVLANTLPPPDHELKVLAQALVKNPGHAPVLMQMAQLESNKGDYHAAEGHLREILAKEPDNSAAGIELGRVLFQLGNVQAAIDQNQDILKRHPSDPDALYNLGAIYANLGNHERAAECWNRLIAANPGSESAGLARESLRRLTSDVRKQ